MSLGMDSHDTVVLKTVMTWLFFFALGIFSLRSAKANPVLLSCNEPEVSGLFEQCREVVLIGNSSPVMRAYSKPEQKVFIPETKNLFYATNFSARDKVLPHERVVVSAQTLWNTSKPGFQSICEVESETSDHLLVISCGRYQHAKIRKDDVWSLKPFSAEKRGPEFSQTNAAKTELDPKFRAP